MPIVNPEVLEKKAKEVEEAAKSVPTKVIGGKTYFKGSGDDWYDSHGEALDSLQIEKQKSEYKKMGLDEFGRSPEQILLAQEKASLLKEKEGLLLKARGIDVKIASLKLEDFKKKKK